MSVQYKRAGWVQIGTQAFKGLHLKFHVKKSLHPDPNAADIQVFGLSPASRALIGSLDTVTVPSTPAQTIVLMGGYEDAVQLLFLGNAKTIDHAKQGPDWVTHIVCGDGELDYKSAFSSFSMGAGTTLAQVITRLGSDMWLDTKTAMTQLAQLVPGGMKFLQGYSAHGRTVRELTRVTAKAEIEWSIQEGSLVLLAKGTGLKERAKIISAETGMVGSPDHGKPQREGDISYLKVKCLLDGSIKPGRCIHLVSQATTGDYRCERVEHQGELDGPAWYSDVEMVPWGSASPAPPASASEAESEEAEPG
jgi:hypothetical protein